MHLHIYNKMLIFFQSFHFVFVNELWLAPHNFQFSTIQISVTFLFLFDLDRIGGILYGLIRACISDYVLSMLLFPLICFHNSGSSWTNLSRVFPTRYNKISMFSSNSLNCGLPALGPVFNYLNMFNPSSVVVFFLFFFLLTVLRWYFFCGSF